MQILTRNSKIKKMSGLITYNFGIPAYKEESGCLTCPMAKDCIRPCYANSGAYIWSNVKKAYQYRYKLTKQLNFVDIINNEIVNLRSNNKKYKLERLRIHDSGDFYSKEYLFKWIRIMHQNPHIKFYAYTKMIKLFNDYKHLFPKNFTYIYSYGGKQDKLINPNVDRHSHVFNCLDDLLKAGYIDASQDDSMALTNNINVGLIAHGNKAKHYKTKAA